MAERSMRWTRGGEVCNGKTDTRTRPREEEEEEQRVRVVARKNKRKKRRKKNVEWEDGGRGIRGLERGKRRRNATRKVASERGKEKGVLWKGRGERNEC